VHQPRVFRKRLPLAAKWRLDAEVDGLEEWTQQRAREWWAERMQAALA